MLQLQQRVASTGIQLSLPDTLAAELGKEGHSRGGARNLRHLVQERVEGPLSVYLLQCSKQPTKVQGILKEGQLQFIG